MESRNPEEIHASVLLDEAMEILVRDGGEIFVDATLGLGGHAEALLERLSNARLIGIDQDTEATEQARKRLERFGSRATIVHANFAEVKSVIAGEASEGVDGILADLGVSSLQFDTGSRGFSFREDAPLDMRMDAESDDPTAAELLATLNEEEIANVIYQFGEERFSRRIARRIVEKREAGTPITTTKQLAELVERSVKRSPKEKTHPATRTFQALRIAVNRELEVLETFITDAVDVLKIGGRLAIISFHSLEDRIVKHGFQKLSGKCTCPPRIPQCVCGAEKRVEILTKKPIVPGDDEMERNWRSRSAKLRAVRKLT
jgi:16S rRNA (cytosine1402-N4)-methyltransferase